VEVQLARHAQTLKFEYHRESGKRWRHLKL
jgi:hypothetical protein